MYNETWAGHFRADAKFIRMCIVLLLPSTKDVSNVTFAAFRLPAGRASPILSSLSRRNLPPFFDLALQKKIVGRVTSTKTAINTYTSDETY